MDSEKKPDYRPEIQGVRALAALLVAAYHIWFGRVSGGVDVFFVVSGFLITGSLVRRAGLVGGLRFLPFWAGLVKRLVPAAATVATVTIIASLIILPQTVWITTIKQAAAALFYVENWSQALGSVDYLADRSSASPFQHYWALSVQGQFYFFWPLLISALLWLAARARSNPSRWIQAGLAAVFVASLGYSVITTRTDQAFAYFDTLARMWEFALGGLLVFILPRLRLSAAARAVLGWTGLLAIVSCGFLLPVEGAFPGYAALWPTLGAAAVLAGGSDSRYGANLVLASRPIAWFGDIAYSFYLWHWPLFILFMVMTPATQPGFVEGTTLILMAGVLAWLTTRWIEEPIRFASFSKKGTRHAFALGAACCLPAVALLGGWSLYTVSERAEARSYEFSVGDPHYPGAAAVAGQAYEREESLYPHFFTLAENVPRSYFDGCHQGLREVEAVPCRYGRPDGPVTVALVGGSHSTQWLPALKQLARRHGWTILNLTKSDCWFSTEVRPGRDTCQQWNLNVMRLLLKNPPDYVFTLATRAGEALEYVPDGYVQQWSALEKLGVRVLAVRDNPWWKKRSPSDCVAVFGEGSEHCRMPRHKGLARVTPTSDGSLPGNTHILDLSRFFCDEDECFPTAGNVLIYRDRHHISKAYVQSLTPYLEQQLSKAAPELVRTGQGGLASGAGR